MKCVPINPFVLAPQMKNVPARIQNDDVFDARASSPNASAIGLPPRGGTTASASLAPYGSSPIDCGRSRMKRTTGTIATIAAAVSDRRAREQRQKDQLPGRRRGRKRPHHEAALLHEPAVGDRRREHHRERAESDAGDDAPGGNQLPGRLREARGQDADRRDREAQHHRVSQPERLHEPGRERAGEPEKRDVDGRRERDGLSAPAHLVLDRQHDDARRRADAGRDEQDDERDPGDDPRIMNLAHDFRNPRDLPFVAVGEGHLTEARAGANVTAMSQLAFGYWYWYTARSVPVR
jgi:hypothetical protein